MDQRKEDKEKEKLLVFQLQILSPSDKDIVLFFFNPSSVSIIPVAVLQSVSVIPVADLYRFQCKSGANLMTMAELYRWLCYAGFKVIPVTVLYWWQYYTGCSFILVTVFPSDVFIEKNCKTLASQETIIECNFWCNTQVKNLNYYNQRSGGQTTSCLGGFERLCSVM